jgi:hypothetical protein
MKFKISILVIIMLLFSQMVYAKKEKTYEKEWCNDNNTVLVNFGNPRNNIKMTDGTFCDCLTDSFAIEIDFPYKWYEGITQAFHYSELTGKNPALALIVRNEKDKIYLKRALRIINTRNLPIQLFIITD